jgi:hypothetical protein
LDEPDTFKSLRRGWFLGDEAFRKELLEQMGPLVKRHHGGGERFETVEMKAERLLAGELKRRGWGRDELKKRRKGDVEKVRIAGQLRKETTMGWDWIARELMMGAPGYAANCVRSNSSPGV